MNAGTVVGMLQALVQPGYKKSAGEKLRAVHHIDTVLADAKCRDGAVVYARQNRKSLSAGEPFNTCMMSLAQSYNEYKNLTLFAEALDSSTPPPGLEVREGEGGNVLAVGSEPLNLDHLRYLQQQKPEKCGDPHCTEDHSSQPLVLRPPCHMGAPSFALFRDDNLELVCLACGSAFAKVKVAPGD